MITAILLFTLAATGDTLPGQRSPVVRDDWFSSDKILHFAVSMNVVGVTHHIHQRYLGGEPDRGRVLSVSLTALAGLGKEIYDKKRKGHFSWKDLIYDAAGIGAAYLIFIR